MKWVTIKRIYGEDYPLGGWYREKETVVRRQTFFKVSATLVGILLLVGVVGLNSAQAFIAYDVPAPSTGNQAWTGSSGDGF